MTVAETKRTRTQQRKKGHRAGAFDIRTVIAILIGLYGLVLVATGIAGTSQADLERAGGLNINLLAGSGMLVFAAAFLTWARLRPVVVPEEDSEERADA